MDSESRYPVKVVDEHARGHVLWIVDSRDGANLRDNVPRDAMMCEVRGMERV